MSSSSWAKRLEGKLSSLTETSSKESIQTLAKWMGFNRKHAAAFCQVLQEQLSTQSNRQVLYLSIMDQVMLLERDNTTKWDRLSELRCALGEQVVLELSKSNISWTPAAKDKLLISGSLLKSWDASNVFGGPTLISQIRKELLNASSSTPTSSSSPKATPDNEKTGVIASSATSPAQAAITATATASTAAVTSSPPPPKPPPAVHVAPAAKKENSASVNQQQEETNTATSKPLPVQKMKVEETVSQETSIEAQEDKEEHSTQEEESPKKKKARITETQESTEVAAMSAVAAPQEESAAAAAEEDDDDDSASKPIASQPPQEEEFDFPDDDDDDGVPVIKVNPKDYIEPCKAIATLQIARDLRSDGAVQLSSLLSGLPQEVRKACAASAEDDDYQISEEQARDFSVKVQEDGGIVDLDLQEELRNIRTFREIVQRQGEARQQLYTLLTKSRCNFGADEAAAAFYAADEARLALKKRKRILADAMELEGLDVPEEKSKATAEQEALVPLPWYKPPPTAAAAATTTTTKDDGDVDDK